MLVDGVPAKHPRRTLTLVGISAIGDRVLLTTSADRKDASKFGQQAFLFEGGLHGNSQSLCGKQQGTNQSILEQSLRSRRLLRHSRGTLLATSRHRWVRCKCSSLDGPVYGALQEGHDDPYHVE